MPWPLYPQGKSSWYSLDRRLGGPGASLDAGAKRKIPSSCQDSNPCSSSQKPSTMPLSYPSSYSDHIRFIFMRPCKDFQTAASPLPKFQLEHKTRPSTLHFKTGIYILKILSLYLVWILFLFCTMIHLVH
jgi:hypothetical protein